ncbi:cytochrome bd oxidase small subunit CydS [Sporosarcina sp. 179-K 3D1 HS]
MNDFLIFYAPFVVLLGSLAVAFYVAPKDRAVRKEEEREK